MAADTIILQRASRYVCPLLLVFGLAGVSGCGAVTGETTQQTVPLDTLSLPATSVPVAVASVTSRPDASELFTSGVYRWGEFDQADIANLRMSLESTLSAAVSQNRLDDSDMVRLYVLIRKYIVASSNAEIAALAAIDWCAARGDGIPLYGEVFYAADQVQWFGTLGDVKNNVNRAIIARIAESSLQLAARDGSAPNLPRDVDGTFDQLEDALDILPDSVASAGYAVAGGASYVSGSTPVTIPWQSAEASRSFLCDEFLERN